MQSGISRRTSSANGSVVVVTADPYPSGRQSGGDGMEVVVDGVVELVAVVE